MRSVLTRSAIVLSVMTGLSRRNAHLGRLLHHVVEARPLERRKEIIDVRPLILRTGLMLDAEHGAALADFEQRRNPLAVPAVEHQDFAPGRRRKTFVR